MHTAGFGAVDGSGTPPTADTAYRIASCTKSFTAAALLLLRDRGVLSLDAPITDFVPQAVLRLPSADSPVPSVRMLMSMSGGLPTDDPWADRQESLSNADFDAVLASGLRFVTVPGTAYEYSNTGFALLGRVIEVVTGRPFTEFVAAEILGPAGLRSTGFDRHVAAPGGLATGHRRLGDAWTPLPFSGPGAYSSIGGLFSTVSDLTRWMSFFVDAFADAGGSSDDRDDRDDLPPPDGGPLSTSSRREMQQLHRIVAAESGAGAGRVAGYGFGLFTEHDHRHGSIASHSGGYPGFSSHMRWHPGTGLGVVALENATYSGAARPAIAALDLLLDGSGHTPTLSLWPETVAARDSVERLLRAWDDDAARELFADNVELDDSLDHRRADFAGAVAAVGGLSDAPVDGAGATSTSPAQLTWMVPGVAGELRCRILLNPQDPPLVQAVRVEAVGDGGHADDRG